MKLRLNLAYDYMRILKRAWSIRLNALAFVFICISLFVPPVRDLFSALALGAVLWSTWARVTRQKRYYK